ncbi:SDR family NAD(P)-dependent oxidoreductase [Nisaea acidiphila]|uniref:SDR family NAD(P)-dependent oxidoreductase n=1 Tax=Nisaea acidiphila TaxID=1862145 RepID=A0A9J7ARI6_9PROT|nr:SDR family NAD(P)-dependent oxidoreductase [Nisaea acidiphila]UUX49185.1 SDR family NAD(P)-dependent oxidoreductase [Nisaea acidiphila]
MAETALIVGAGAGLSASLARLCAKEGMKIALAARNTDKLGALAAETGAQTKACDVADKDSVAALFSWLDGTMGTPDLVVFNPSKRARGPLVDLDPDEVLAATTVTCHGAFLVAQQAAKRMLAAGHGTILFTGASAGVKGYPQSAPFAMGKFGLRGLAQSMARELHPQNIHVGHFVIDGGIRTESDTREAPGENKLLDPEAIAETYLQFHRQPRSSWAWEIELRPWKEAF